MIIVGMYWVGVRSRTGKLQASQVRFTVVLGEIYGEGTGSVQTTLLHYWVHIHTCL